MSLKESDLKLISLNCKKAAVEPICVLDPEHECCETIPREVIAFENGEMIKHGNSAIVSLKLHFSDPIEQFIFDRIRLELWRDPGSSIKVIREPEEGFDISFFLNTEMVKTTEQRQKLINYWSDFERNMRRILTDGKMVINKYVRSKADTSRLS